MSWGGGPARWSLRPWTTCGHWLSHDARVGGAGRLPASVQGVVRQNVGNSQAPPPMLSSRDQNMTVDLYGPQDPCSLRSRPARSALGEIRKDIQL